jgi:UDP-N-acetylglucosamine--N-acetylmuramyl-(pentapeptide) pyrophosphoryl-undecaprenol N-acetylglucosamine transferase
MAQAYAWADLVLCRAGALTVCELMAAGRPAVLVPYPHAVDDHQTANARFLTEHGAARLLPQSALDASSLGGLLEALLADPAVLLEMGSAAYRLARRDAAQRVAEVCEELAA